MPEFEYCKTCEIRKTCNPLRCEYYLDGTAAALHLAGKEGE